jgi:hypothetical protein
MHNSPWMPLGGSLAGELPVPSLSSAALTAIEALTPSADTFPYYTGANSAALATLTSYIRTLLDDTTAAAARTTLTLGTGDSPTFTGLTLTGDLSVQGSSTLGNGTATDSVTISGGTTAVTTALSVTGNGANGLVANLVSGVATAGQSFGTQITGGTNSSDYALRVLSQGLTEFLRIRGDGLSGFGVNTPPARLTVLGANSATTNDFMCTFDASGNYRHGIANTFNSVSPSGNTMNFLVANASPTLQTTALTLRGDGLVLIPFDLEVDGSTSLGNAAGDSLVIASSSVTWSNNPTHSGNHTYSGNVTVNGNTTIGNASTDTLTIAPNAVTWSNAPTHSNNHTFSGNITVTGTATLNGNMTFGDASGDTMTIAPNAITWSNAPTHSNDHTFSGFVMSKHATAGIGYGTGAGGAQTQTTNKSTGVTLNTICGQITMNGAALAAGAKVSFTLTNSAIITTDGVIVWVDQSATSKAYRASVAGVGAGSCDITVENITAGSLSESIVLGFAVIKSVTS